MDNELTKKIVGYVVGGAIGAMVGFGVATFVLDNFMEEDIDWDYDEDEMEALVEEDPRLWKNAERAIKDGTMKPIKKKREPVDYAAKSKNVNPDLRKLADKYRKGDPDEVTKTLVPEIEEEIQENAIDRSKPYFITKIEFEEEMMTNQKIYLTLFEDDDILTDAEDKTVITNPPEKFLGPDGLSSWGRNEEDPDVVYIRNEGLGTDYEVTLIHASYEETILNTKKKKQPDRSKVVKVPSKKEVDEDED